MAGFFVRVVRCVKSGAGLLPTIGRIYTECDGQGRIKRLTGVFSIESYAEKAIAHAINEGVAAVDPVRHLDQEHEHMHVVRHGPQQNFLGYREEYETEEAIKDKGSLAVVANPGPFPIAIVNKTDWTIVENLEEWGTYFRDLNIVQPVVSFRVEGCVHVPGK
ncbi:TPA: hypothetical protein ACJG2I_001037 [Salmonella enterica subsp. houtenae]